VIKMALKVGDQLFSDRLGFVNVEAFRGKGKDQEFMIKVLDEEYWVPISKVHQ
jgi:hypothetical protein